MIEKTVIAYLAGALPGIQVVAEVQENAPPYFVRVAKTGGGEHEFICDSTLAIQSYAPSLLEAANLNEQVKAAMRGLTALDTVTHVELNSDYEFTDTARKRHRYQAVYDITHYPDD